MLRKRRPRPHLPQEQAGDATAALAAAVVLLSRRDFCSAELVARLQADGFTAEAAHTALAELSERRYVDDERYARAFVAARAERGQGPQRMRRDLSELGIDGALADVALQAHAEGQGGWSRLAREVRIRRFGLPAPRNWRETARQSRFLQYRGFSNDDIRAAVGEDAAIGDESVPESDAALGDHMFDDAD
ncbi:MAG: regulatory protein RecX [Steroidobacteraceae bacterium]